MIKKMVSAFLAVLMLVGMVLPPQSLGLAPSSEIGSLADFWNDVELIRRPIKKGLYVRFDLGVQATGYQEIGKGFDAAVRGEVLNQLKSKWKEVESVFRMRYPQALEVRTEVFLLDSFYPHLLSLKESGRNWETRYVAKVLDIPARKLKIYVTIGLFLDPRATPDRLAHVLAENMGLSKPSTLTDFDVMIADDIERAKAVAALQKSSRYDEIAQQPHIRRDGEAMAQGKHHDLWKSEETAIATVRKRIQDVRPDLWTAYETVRRQLKAGQIRLADYPPELLKVLAAFYAITYKDFINPDGIALWAAGHPEVATFFPTYGMALVKSFPELDLNPVLFSDSGAYKNVPDAIGAVHYRFATEHPELWRSYVEILKKLRAGTIRPDTFSLEMIAVHDAMAKIRKDQFEATHLKTLIEHPEPFGGSHLRALMESFPGIGLYPPSLDQYENKWAIRDHGVAEVKLRLARFKPELWAKTLRVREAIRTGKIDIQDYSPETIEVMQAYYDLTWNDFAMENAMGLRQIMEADEAPYWQRKRSSMLADILPEFPWTPIGFHEKNCWREDRNIASEMRFKIAKFNPELFKKIRGIEKKVQSGEWNVDDFPSPYIQVVDEIAQTLVYEWFNAHLSRGAITDTAKPGVKRSTSDILRMTFPDLQLNPVALMAAGAWGDIVQAPREVRFRLARKFPDLWEAYRWVSKRHLDGKIKVGDFPPEWMYVIESMHRLKGPLLKSAQDGLGLEGPLRKDRPSAFNADPFTLLKMSFPEIPWFIAEYSQGKVQGDTEEEELLALYRKSRESALGEAAVGWTVTEFQSHQDRIILKEGKKLEELDPFHQKLARAGVTAADVASLQGFLKSLPVLLVKDRNVADCFLVHFENRLQDDKKGLARILYALWQFDAARFQSFLKAMFVMDPYHRSSFRYVFPLIPEAALVVPMLKDPKNREMLQSWLARKKPQPVIWEPKRAAVVEASA